MADVLNKTLTEDFYALDKDFYDLKYTGGIIQMIVGVALFLVNRFIIHENIVLYGSIGVFCLGFIAVGVKWQTTISPTRKLIKKNRGFYFIQFNTYYSSSEIDYVKLIHTTRRGTDRNGIGPTRTKKLITTYHTELVLKDGKKARIHSEEKRKKVKEFSEKVAFAMGVRFENEVSLNDENKFIHS